MRYVLRYLKKRRIWVVIARSEEPLTFEGSDENRRIILIQISSPGKAQEFYSSPEYQKARNLLKEAAAGEMRVADGLQHGRIGGNSPEQKKKTLREI